MRWLIIFPSSIKYLWLTWARFEQWLRKGSVFKLKTPLLWEHFEERMWGKNVEALTLCSFLCSEYFLPQTGEEKPQWVAAGLTAVIELPWGSQVRQLPGKDFGTKVRTWQGHIWFCYVWLLAHGPLQPSDKSWSRTAGGLSGLLWYQQVRTLVLML